ncbi:hypothetical protein [Pseudonocardia phyllosphaerae]|uniref:hypothetical protein n=1 Tax=Pseudonocardia phyllosphaerae TaxID=3390502 RepID=UPI003978F66C
MTDRQQWGRRAVWLPGLAVALGAAIATAHGLFEVAIAARVPPGIAWIYPLITDGLALVAYAATARLGGSAARYAWTVVIVSAGLSGLAQAVYLSSDAAGLGGGLAVSPALRFGVGAWPAIAAAVVAHLLYLLAAPGSRELPAAASQAGSHGAPEVSRPVPSHRDTAPAGHSDVSRRGDPATVEHPRLRAVAGLVWDTTGTPVAPQDRARTTAARHCSRHGSLPTVRELQTLAAVGRGTAARALQHLRDHTPAPTTEPAARAENDPHDREP